MHRRAIVGAVVGVLVLAGLIGWAVSAGGGGLRQSLDSGDAQLVPAQSGEAEPFEAGPGSGPAGVPAPKALPQGEESGTTGVAAGAGDATLPNIESVAGVEPRVVKTASLSIRVKQRDVFADQFQKATLIARRHGGFVSSSQTSQDEFESGTVVLRVPASEFERALAELRDLGRVRGEEVSGEDVTAQFVDLQARLRNWEAQETVLLGLMAEAQTVEESIQVQRRLQDVQLEIERIRGQLRLLNDQTDFSTISVSMFESGAALQQEKEDEGGLSLGRGWELAVDGFIGVISAVVIGLGYLIPIGGLVALGWFAYRRFRPQPAPAKRATPRRAPAA
jgi:hypothetical protein